MGVVDKMLASHPGRWGGKGGGGGGGWSGDPPSWFMWLVREFTLQLMLVYSIV